MLSKDFGDKQFINSNCIKEAISESCFALSRWYETTSTAFVQSYNRETGLITPSTLSIDFLPISLAFPLNRFISRMVSSVTCSKDFTGNVKELFSQCNFPLKDLVPYFLLDGTARFLAAEVHGRNGQLVRNGLWLSRLLTLERKGRYSTMGNAEFDADITTLQIVSVLSSPAYVAYELAAKFGVLPQCIFSHWDDQALMRSGRRNGNPIHLPVLFDQITYSRNIVSIRKSLADVKSALNALDSAMNDRQDHIHDVIEQEQESKTKLFIECNKLIKAIKTIKENLEERKKLSENELTEDVLHDAREQKSLTEGIFNELATKFKAIEAIDSKLKECATLFDTMNLWSEIILKMRNVIRIAEPVTKRRNGLWNLLMRTQEYSNFTPPVPSPEEDNYLDYLYGKESIGEFMLQFPETSRYLGALKTLASLQSTLAESMQDDTNETRDYLQAVNESITKFISLHGTTTPLSQYNFFVTNCQLSNDKYNLIAEELSWTLIATVLDRTNICRKGETVSERDGRVIREDIDHLTAAHKWSYDALHGAVHKSENESFATLIRERCDMVKSPTSGTNGFVLKPQYWNDIHQFNIHVMPEERSDIEERYIEHMKKEHPSDSFFTMPAPVYHQPTDSFACLPGLLHNPVFFALCINAFQGVFHEGVLSAIMLPTEGSKFISFYSQRSTSTQRSVALALIGLTIAAQTYKEWKATQDSHESGAQQQKFQHHFCDGWPGVDSNGEFDLLRAMHEPIGVKSDGMQLNVIELIKLLRQSEDMAGMAPLVNNCSAAFYSIDKTAIFHEEAELQRTQVAQRKRAAKERQEAIRKKFLEQQAKFAKKAQESGLYPTNDDSEDDECSSEDSKSPSNAGTDCASTQDDGYLSVCGVCRESLTHHGQLFRAPAVMPFFNRVSGLLRVHRRRVNTKEPESVFIPSLESQCTAPTLWWKPVGEGKARIMTSCGHSLHRDCKDAVSVTVCPVCRAEQSGGLPILPYTFDELLSVECSEAHQGFAEWKENLSSLCSTIAWHELKFRTLPLTRKSVFPFSSFERTIIAGLYQSQAFREKRMSVIQMFENETAPHPFGSDAFSFYYSLDAFHKKESRPEDFYLCFCCEIIRSYLVRGRAAHTETPSHKSVKFNNINTMISTWLCSNFNLAITVYYLFIILV